MVGPILVFLTYTWLIYRRYPGTWATAAKIAGIAWVTTVIVLSVFAMVGFATFEAMGFET